MSIGKFIKIFSKHFLALVLNLFYHMFRFSSHGDPGVEKRSWGQKDIFERSRISFNKFRTSAENTRNNVAF
jgi:hypothetical protein